MAFQPGNRYGRLREGPLMKRYRCVYCKKIFMDLTLLPSHEAQCPFRAVVKTQWQMVIEKARRRERGR